MSYHQDTAERVRRILAAQPDVVEKKMVGILSFMVNGRMCCGVTSTGLLVRVGPGAREHTLAEPDVRPMEFGGRVLAGYVQVDPAGYATETPLAKWVQRGIDFVSTLPRKRPSGRKQDRRQSRS